MDLNGKIIVVTGAASGIGRALALRFAAEGAKAVVCADVNEAGAQDTAEQIDVGIARRVDVSIEGDIAKLIDLKGH